MEEVRINKYLSICGVCSRREADQMIEEGLVTVNGLPAHTGQKVTEEDEVVCDGCRILPEEEPVVLAVFKPVGIVCTTARFPGEDNIVDMIDWPTRVFPIGRLDKISEGLILMTNVGELSDKILHGTHFHEKEYEVVIDRPVTEEFLRRMRSGVHILDRVTRPCRAEKIGDHSFRIILTQGMNRQIRRMCEACGCRVRHLRRTRIMNIRLGSLPPGGWRQIEGRELEELLAGLERK